MPDATLIIVAVVIIAILIAAVWWYSMRQRSAKLRERFGPEYERTVADKGDTRKAEDELTDRQKRVSQLDIRPLAADERRRFNDEWRAVQARFVDDPSTAVRDADTLVGRVMEARGYPVGDFEQRSADVSVDHPTVLEHYRAAHEIALRHAQGQASTEDLRQAMVDYRALFAELLEEPRTVETSPRHLTSGGILMAEQRTNDEVMNGRDIQYDIHGPRSARRRRSLSGFGQIAPTGGLCWASQEGSV